jgi:hypothetical protein
VRTANGIVQLVDSNQDRRTALGVNLQAVLGIIIKRECVQKLKDLLTKEGLIGKGCLFLGALRLQNGLVRAILILDPPKKVGLQCLVIQHQTHPLVLAIVVLHLNQSKNCAQEISTHRNIKKKETEIKHLAQRATWPQSASYACSRDRDDLPSHESERVRHR